MPPPAEPKPQTIFPYTFPFHFPPGPTAKARLTYLMHTFKDLPIGITSRYKALPCHKYITWRDWLIRAYIAGITYHALTTTYERVPHTHQPIQVTSIATRRFDPWLRIRWTTDLPCYSACVYRYKPPLFTLTQHERRGLLIRGFDTIHFPCYAGAWSYPWEYSTQHQTTAVYIGDHTRIYYFFQYFERYTDPEYIDDWSPSRSPIFLRRLS